jgi:hypothetical protein
MEVNLTANIIREDTLSQCDTTAPSVSSRSCTKDEKWPLEVDLQELASNRPVLLRSKDVVVNDLGKGVKEGVRYVLRR